MNESSDRLSRLETVSALADRMVVAATQWFCLLLIALMVVIVAQVSLRYGFSAGQVFLEELQWHLYAAGILMGLSYSQVGDSHIRVDLFHANWSRRSQGIVEILGIPLLALPFVAIVFYHSLDFVYDSWRVGESSDAPLGLSYRWIIKSFIPIGFALLGLSLVSRLLREIGGLLRGGRDRQERCDHGSE